MRSGAGARARAWRTWLWHEWRVAAERTIGCSMTSRRSRAWTADASDGVKALAPRRRRVDAAARLRLDFDFGRIRRLRVRAPRAAARSAGELRARRSCCAANAPVNNFEVKLADASGDNVWWFERRDFEFPQRVAAASRSRSARSRSPGARPATARCDASTAIEFVVGAGRGGGNGSIEIDDLSCRELPPPPAHFPPPDGDGELIFERRLTPAHAVDGDPRTAWRSDPKAGAAQTSQRRSRHAARVRRPRAPLARRRAAARATTSRLPTTASPGSVLRRVTNGDGGEGCAAAAGSRRRASSGSILLDGAGARLRARRARGQGPGLRRLAQRVLPGAWQRTRRAASTRAASRASNRTGRLSASTAAPKARSFPKTARWRSRSGGFSIEPFIIVEARASSPGPTSSTTHIAARRLSARPERAPGSMPRMEHARHGVCARHARRAPSSWRATR